ncbi:MAG TPA: TIGR01777 family oxidoreductase [Blastocatellia bacterium]|nr:TIGR01777 family oxidoreductase [Blastocatellia bacterium]
MRIAVTGASGLIGSALVSFLAANDHDCTRLVRSSPSGPLEARWDPATGQIEPAAAIEGLDAVVNLAGEPIAEGRWTTAKKSRIRESRVGGTRRLAEALLRLDRPPRILVAASAIGFYGDRGDEVLTEDSAPGTGFLADACRDWEKAAQPAVDAGIRVVHLRIGLVLSNSGGALPRMLLPFRMGVGGRIGSGKQYMSWIALDDLVGVAYYVLTDDAARGPINAVSPNPVTNLEFTKALGKALSRPTVFPLPGFAARLALGEMADELLLASQRVKPARLISSRFQFKLPEIESALRSVLSE